MNARYPFLDLEALFLPDCSGICSNVGKGCLENTSASFRLLSNLCQKSCGSSLLIGA
jgi:hypothetical protein